MITNNTRLSIKDDSKTLLINPVKKRDAGFYTCIGSNSRSTYDLIVKSKFFLIGKSALSIWVCCFQYKVFQIILNMNTFFAS